MTSLALVVIAMVAFGAIAKAQYKKPPKAMSATTPKTRSKRKRSKLGTASFAFFLTFLDFAASRATGALAAKAASSSSSSCKVSSSSPSSGVAVARPANSPIGRVAAAAVEKSSAPSSSIVSSKLSSVVGGTGISGFDCGVLATCRPTAPASGRRPASLVISTRCFLASSALRFNNFMLTILCRTLARLGKTKATILPSLARTLSMIPVISSSISM